MRDPHLDRALAAATRRGRAAGACPDATIPAAYADGSLTADERAEFERHAADCPTCVETLAVLASLDQSEPARTPRRWWDVSTATRWGWLVPLATAVLVVAVWVRTDRSTGPAVSPAAPKSPAAAVAEQPTLTARAVAPSEAPVLEPAPPASRQKAASLPERRDAGLTAMRAERRAVAPPASAMAGVLEDKDAKKEREQVVAERAAQAAAALSANAAQPPADAPPPAPAQPSAAGSPPAGAAAPATAKADAFERANENLVAGALKTARASSDTLMKQQAAPLIVDVAGSATRVRVANDRIERSLDGGRTWAIEWPGPVGIMRVGTCPTIDVCWLGGDAGAVLVRQPDARWAARGIPDVASPVTALASTTATAATATLADGRQFSTTDAGVHWQAIPSHP